MSTLFSPKRVRILGVLIVFALSTVSYGADSGKSLFEMSLEELMATGITAVGSNVKDVRPEEVMSRIEVITKKDIRLTGARNLPELLSILVPGAAWVVDHDASIMGFRGFAPDNDKQVLILLNGQNVNEDFNTGSQPFTGLLDLSFIERLEIIVGPGSSLFGSGPILAVVNIITADFNTEEADYCRVGTKTGSGDLRMINYSAKHGKKDDLQTAFHASFYQATHGYSPAAQSSTWVLPADVVADDQYLETAPSFQLFGSAKHKEAEFSIYRTSFCEDMYNGGSGRETELNTFGANLKNTFELPVDGWDVVPSIFFKQSAHNWGLSRLNPAAQLNYGQEQAGSQLLLNYTGDPLKGSIGTKYAHNRWGNDPFKRNNYEYVEGWGPLWNQAGTESVPGAGFTKGCDTWSTDAYDVFGELFYKLTRRNTAMASLLYSAEENTKADNVAPRVGYAFNTDDYGIKVFYTRAFLNPSPWMMGTGQYPDTSNFPKGGLNKEYINPDLETQTIDNFETRLLWKGSQTWSAEGGVFYYINRDMPISAGPGPGVTAFDPDKFWYTFHNAVDISSYGFEGAIAFTPSPDLSMKLSQASLGVADATYDRDVPTPELFADFDGDHFLNFPENVTRLHVTYLATDRLTLRSDLMYEPGRYRASKSFKSFSDVEGIQEVDLGKEETKSSDFLNVNLGTIYALNDTFDLGAHVYNVLDDRPYFPTAMNPDVAYNPIGRTWRLELTAQF